MASSFNLSQEARKSLDDFKAWRNEATEGGGAFVNLADGETKILLFDPNDMAIQTVEFEPGKPRKRAKYGVFDVSAGSYQKQYLTGGKNLSLAIDSNIEEGNTVLKITRTGQKFDTKYSVVSTQLPGNYRNPLH